MHSPSHKYPISARQYLRRAPRGGRDQRRWDNAAACLLACLPHSRNFCSIFWLWRRQWESSRLKRTNFSTLGLVCPLSRTTGAGGGQRDRERLAQPSFHPRRETMTTRRRRRRLVLFTVTKTAFCGEYYRVSQQPRHRENVKCFGILDW